MLIPVETEHVRVLFDTDKKKYVAHVAVFDETSKVGFTNKTLEEK
jgi:hypothetical protein